MTRVRIFDLPDGRQALLTEYLGTGRVELAFRETRDGSWGPPCYPIQDETLGVH